jgi:hypothetical protein
MNKSSRPSPCLLHMAKRADVIYRGRVNIKATVEHTLPAEFHQGHTYSYFSPSGGVACFASAAGKGFTYWATSIADTADAVTGETKSFLDKDNQISSASLLSLCQILLLR